MPELDDVCAEGGLFAGSRLRCHTDWSCGLSFGPVFRQPSVWRCVSRRRINDLVGLIGWILSSTEIPTLYVLTGLFPRCVPLGYHEPRLRWIYRTAGPVRMSSPSCRIPDECVSHLQVVVAAHVLVGFQLALEAPGIAGMCQLPPIGSTLTVISASGCIREWSCRSQHLHAHEAY